MLLLCRGTRAFRKSLTEMSSAANAMRANKAVKASTHARSVNVLFLINFSFSKISIVSYSIFLQKQTLFSRKQRLSRQHAIHVYYSKKSCKCKYETYICTIFVHVALFGQTVLAIFHKSGFFTSNAYSDSRRFSRKTPILSIHRPFFRPQCNG